MVDKLILGIDTSNYTTSIAITRLDGSVVIDNRRMLEVKKGNRGLGQSEALFQHIKNLPEMWQEILNLIDIKDIVAIAVSNKPRNLISSYMPVFLGGYNFAKTIAYTLTLPLYEFSHQEGHIKAISFDNNLKSNFIALHVSGGTTEILLANTENNRYNIEILGSSLDISLGQLIDRVGIKCGLDFPAGKEIDELAMSVNEECEKIPRHFPKLPKIKLNNGSFNLSGIENQSYLALEKYDNQGVVYSMMKEITDLLDRWISWAIARVKEKYDIDEDIDVVIAGGVSESRFLRKELIKSNKKIIFGNYGKDNAVGISLLGGEKWQSSQF